MYRNFTFEFFAFLPEIFLSLGLCFFLLFFSFLVANKKLLLSKNINFIVQKQALDFSSFILFITCCLIYNNPYLFGTYFFGTLQLNLFIIISKYLIILFSLIILQSNKFYLKDQQILSFEYFLFFLLSIFAILLLVSANDFIILYLCLELQTLCFYVLSTYKRNSAFSTEAGLKYLVMGSFVSGLLLFGISFLYGFTGTSNYDVLFKFFNFIDINYLVFGTTCSFFFVILTFIFKLNGAPFHQWALDVYEGSPIKTTVLFSTVSKLSLFVALISMLNTCFPFFYIFWNYLFIVIGVSSIVFSIFGSIYQKKLKRFILFSSISHVGYIFLSLGAGSFIGFCSGFIYLFIYLLISVCFWILFSSIKKSLDSEVIILKYIDELRYIVKDNVYAILILSFIILSIAGIPPIIGFYAKFYIFFALVEAKLYACGFFLIFGSAISCFYYLRVLVIIFFSKSKNFYTLPWVPAYRNYINKNVAIILSSLFFISIFLFINPKFFYLLMFKSNLSLFLLNI